MIGIALGLSGVRAAAVSGWIIDRSGFSVHYVVLAVICLLGLILPVRVTETVTARRESGQEGITSPAG
jgi:sugar phosphate permease